MKLTLLVLLIGVVAADLSVEWDKFKQQYNKQYATAAEETERKQIFLENLEEMLAFQKTHPSATFTTGINHLFDRRMEELTRGRRLRVGSSIAPSKSAVDVKRLPESLDWRERGVLTPVNDELGTIITAVVSTEVVESLHAIKTGQVIQGSIGQVFDCCPQPIDAFDCIQNMSGICRKTDYPAPTGKCEPNKCQPFTSFDVIKRMVKPDEDEMLVWLQESTLWAEVNTAGEGFRSYTGGIFDEPTCSKGPVDYVVQIVGYGTDDGIPYWLIRLSWGEQWGENGYLRMVRGKNMCRVSEVVIQVASTQKGTASQQYALIPIYFMLLLTIVSRLFMTSF